MSATAIPIQCKRFCIFQKIYKYFRIPNEKSIQFHCQRDTVVTLGHCNFSREGGQIYCWEDLVQKGQLICLPPRADAVEKLHKARWTNSELLPWNYQKLNRSLKPIINGGDPQSVPYPLNQGSSVENESTAMKNENEWMKWKIKRIPFPDGYDGHVCWLNFKGKGERYHADNFLERRDSLLRMTIRQKVRCFRAWKWHLCGFWKGHALQNQNFGWFCRNPRTKIT